MQPTIPGLLKWTARVAKASESFSINGRFVKSTSLEESMNEAFADLRNNGYNVTGVQAVGDGSFLILASQLSPLKTQPLGEVTGATYTYIEKGETNTDRASGPGCQEVLMALAKTHLLSGHAQPIGIQVTSVSILDFAKIVEYVAGMKDK